MEHMIRKYSNGEVTVVWQPNKCIHSSICWRNPEGLPEVFRPDEKPWIDIYAAETDEIIETVKKCPSRALTYFMNETESAPDEVEDEKQEGKSDCVVTVMNNGPLLIYGNITIKDAKGNEIQRSNVTSFCRCALSKQKPFCDGTHHYIQFDE